MAKIAGNSSGNKLHATSNSDRVYGFNGQDYLLGNGGDDSIYGGGGSDTLYGGYGKDYLFGGAGNDTYMIRKGDFDIIHDDSGRYDRVFASPIDDRTMRFRAMDYFDDNGNPGRDGLLDSLLVTDKAGHGFRILEYFDNNSKNPYYSDPGDGLVEQLVFHSIAYSFDDMLVLAQKG